MMRGELTLECSTLPLVWTAKSAYLLLFLSSGLALPGAMVDGSRLGYALES